MGESPLPTVVVNGQIFARVNPAVARAEAEEVLRVLAREAALDLVGVIPEGTAAPDVGPIRWIELPVPRGAIGRILFDQWHVPRVARRLGDGLILSLHVGAPLTSSAPAVIVGDVWAAVLKSRLETSLGRASVRGAAAVLVPDDLAEEPPPGRCIRVPPLVPAKVLHSSRGDGRSVVSARLPEAYALSLEEDAEGLALILAAWTWAQGSVGESTPLVLGAVSDASERRMREAIRSFGRITHAEVVRIAEDEIGDALGRSSVFVHAGGRTTASLLRWALAAGVPVAAAGTPVAATILGAAGHVAPPGDARRLGAACISLLVEEPFAEDLRRRGLAMAARYHAEGPRAWIGALDAIQAQRRV